MNLFEDGERSVAHALSIAAPRVRPALFALALLALVSLATRVAADPAAPGSVCVAPKPSPEERSVASPTGRVPDVSYSVTIDGRDEVVLAHASVSWVRSLDPRRPHSVVILADGRQIQSFLFSFEPRERELCLFLSPFYLTWQLWPIYRTGDWCPCTAIEPADSPPAQAPPNSES